MGAHNPPNQQKKTETALVDFSDFMTGSHSFISVPGACFCKSLPPSQHLRIADVQGTSTDNMTFPAKTFTRVSSPAGGRLMAEQRDNSTQANLLTSELIRATYRNTHASEVSRVHLEAAACSFLLHHVQVASPAGVSSLSPLVNCLHN